jgi:uncharacterized Zn-finger protein
MMVNYWGSNDRENFANINQNEYLLVGGFGRCSNENDKKFTCGYNGCLKSYTTAGNLKTHVKIHRGINQYPPFFLN